MKRSTSKQTTRTENTQQATVSVDLTTEDVETLLKLRDAGLIDLDGIEVPSVNPKLLEWTHEEFKRHMATVQQLRTRTPQGRPSTVLNRLRYLRYLENHPVPVQLRPPDENSWLEHVYYRMEEEGATGSAMNHYRKTLQSFLKFLGVEVWPCLENRFEEPEPHWTLPPKETVPRFWLEDLHHDRYKSAVYAHMFHYGFHVGVRPPSELVSLDVSDVDFDARRITVTEIKKGGRRRDIENVEPFVLDAKNAKSLKNYLDHWRPEVDTGESDAFFLNADGNRFNVTVLGGELSELGKKIWPQFVPYTMRRWVATNFLIANDFNVYATAEQLGDTVATVEKHYLDKARTRAAMKGQFRTKRLYRKSTPNAKAATRRDEDRP